MPYSKVFVGTDGSETARIAERAATTVAAASQGQLLILSAHADEGGERAAGKVVDVAAKEAERRGVVAERLTAEGEPAALIVELADRMDADLIVVGDVGMGGAKRFRLGGVADHVSHNMPCDLLIVRTSRAEPGGVPATYQNVLIATDGSPTADHAAREGTEFAVTMGAGVTLVHVGDELLGRVVLKDTAERLGDPELPIKAVKDGDPGDAIVELAQREGHDLVVIGNKGMSGALRFAMGTVPNKISHNAPCDVLIVNTAGRSLDDIQAGHGALVVEGGKKIAAYRDDSGDLVTLSPKCKHLGCTVGWNDSATTWDCPCHGSRYDARGKVIQGPAQRDLDPIEL
jgi:nucleotide-binding universal stress UspA family protein/nitrite reductase/ring-hydroxylating ferredoxin subunit